MSSSLLNFSSTAFRLELLPEYDVPEEKEALAAYRAKRQVNMTFHRPWIDSLKQARLEGKIVQRVRGIPQPMTSYLHFEIQLCYMASVEAGEQIRLHNRADRTQLSIKRQQDFWLLDDQRVILMNYRPDGSFDCSEEISQPKLVAPFSALSRALWHEATPLDDFHFFDQVGT